MTKKSIFGWMILGATCLGVLFFLVSFRIISSQLAVNSEVGASRQNTEASPVEFTQLTTQLVVEGDDPLARAIQVEITRLAKNDNSIFHVNFESTPGEVAQSPLLVVTLKEHGSTWTPVYARTALEVEVAYASNGDVSFREANLPNFTRLGISPFGGMRGTTILPIARGGSCHFPGTGITWPIRLPLPCSPACKSSSNPDTSDSWSVA
jgi:hypothetical protein